MSKPGLAAVEIGNLLGASAQEINRLLAEQGFLALKDGFYTLTEKGSEFAAEVLQSSSALPQAKTWTARYWRPDILKQLVATPEKLAAVRSVLADERTARNAARMTERAAQEAARLAAEKQQIMEHALAAARSIRMRNGILACVAGAAIGLTVYGAYKAAPTLMGARQERKAALVHDGASADASTAGSVSKCELNPPQTTEGVVKSNQANGAGSGDAVEEGEEPRAVPPVESTERSEHP